MMKITKKNLLFTFLSIIIIGLSQDIYWDTFASTNIDTNDFPVANFTYAPEDPTDTETIHFTDLSYDPDGWIVAWIWNFGDENTSTKQHPFYQYTDDGIYVINLTVIDNNRTATSISKTITVFNVPPVAECGPDQIANKSFAEFNASGSYDPDGEIVNYTWNFNNTPIGYGKSITHGHISDGKYNITLIVRDDDNASDNDSCTILVDTKPPVTHPFIKGKQGANRWFVNEVTVSFNVTDDNSGTKETKYRLDESIWYRYQEPFTIDFEGEHSLTYYSVDNASNKEQLETRIIKIDKKNPSLTLIRPKERYLYIFNKEKRQLPKNTLVLGHVVVEIGAADTGSGIDRVEFYVNNTLTHITRNQPFTWVWDTPSLGRSRLMYIAYDKAGHHSSDDINLLTFIL